MISRHKRAETQSGLIFQPTGLHVRQIVNVWPNTVTSGGHQRSTRLIKLILFPHPTLQTQQLTSEELSNFMRCLAR
jgi:hypothetical protein